MAGRAPSVDLVICRELAGVGTCTFDELAHRLSTYSWAQVFSAVDRLSRQGTISVSRARGVDYLVSNRSGSSHSRAVAGPGVPSGTISGDSIPRRRVKPASPAQPASTSPRGPRLRREASEQA